MEIHKSYYKDLAVLNNTLIIDYSTVRLYNKLKKGENTTDSIEDVLNNNPEEEDLSNLGFNSPEELITLKIGSSDNITITKDSDSNLKYCKYANKALFCTRNW